MAHNRGLAILRGYPMVATLLLLGLLVVAAFTDVRRHRIYNWTTYPGMLAAVGANACAACVGFDHAAIENRFWGLIGVGDSLAGLLGCGFLMLVCYVFFPGGVGGGDVKLIAMMGAFLGLSRGLEVTLWTFVLGGCTALVVLTWRWGAFQTLRRVVRWTAGTLRLRSPAPLNEEERQGLKAKVFLAPSGLAAVLAVQLPWPGWF